MMDILRSPNTVHRYPVILSFIILIIVLEVGFANRTYAMGAHTTVDSRRLYIYSSGELKRFFEDMGYKDLWYNNIAVSRNSDGTALRFINGRKKKGIIAGYDGSIKFQDIPGDLAWLNDDNQAVIWVTLSDNRSVTHYANNTYEPSPFFPAHGPDSSGRYFVKEDLSLTARDLCYTRIYATERPDIPLVKTDICGEIKIFYKDKKVYLAGKQLRDGKWQEEIRIFQHKNNTSNTLEQIDRIIIPRPVKSLLYFYAVDLSPWDDEMLFVDAHDFPSRSAWYSFNLKTRQLKEVGKVPWLGGYAFYLQRDILKKVTEEKQKQQKPDDK